jgi:hypothetical protein
LFGALLTNLDDGVSVVEQMIAVAEVSRLAVAKGSPAGDLRDAITEICPSDTDWRLYDHCAAVTRLYALFEEFFTGAVTEWLAALPQFYGRYADLPESVRKAYRVGTAEILAKHGGDRYAHLTEDQVIRGLAEGLAGHAYALGSDAFLIDERNLRREKVQRVLQAVGITDPWERIGHSREVVRWEQAASGDQKTLAAELSLFVSYRNEAAHGSVSEILSSDGLREIAILVRVLAHAIADAIVGEEIDQLKRVGRLRLVGRVIREFSDNVLGIETAAGEVKVGQQLIIQEGLSGFEASIESLEVENVRHDSVTCADGTKIGVKVPRSARVGSEVWAETALVPEASEVEHLEPEPSGA